MAERYRRAGDLIELARMMQTTLYGVSVEGIAEHFEVSRRTAERMLAAVRSRAPDIQHQIRHGQKFWRLPSSSAFLPAELPDELEGLSRRVAELEEEIVARKLRSESERTIADHVLGVSAVGIFILDADFHVIWVNDALLRYFGLERGAVLGQDKRTLIRQGIREIFEESAEFESRVFATYDDNSYVEHFECHVLPRKGRGERWLEHWSQPILEGPHAGGRLEHYIDITPRVRDRELNRRERWALPARNGHLQQQDKARQLAAHATEFICAPLDSIVRCAREAIENDEQEGGDSMKRILELAANTYEAVQVTLGRLARPQPELEPTSLVPLIQDLAERLRPHALEQKVEVRVEIAPEIDSGPMMLDPELVRWALFEFVCNAMRAIGATGGTITLLAEVVGSGSHVWLAVSDTGPGVPEEERGFVFNPFYTTHRDAAGVGLVKAQQVAREHGGQIGIEHSEGEGAIFYMELPIERPSAHQGGPRAATPAAPASVR